MLPDLHGNCTPWRLFYKPTHYGTVTNVACHLINLSRPVFASCKMYEETIPTKACMAGKYTVSGALEQLDNFNFDVDDG